MEALKEGLKRAHKGGAGKYILGCHGREIRKSGRRKSHDRKLQEAVDNHPKAGRILGEGRQNISLWRCQTGGVGHISRSHREGPQEYSEHEERIRKIADELTSVYRRLSYLFSSREPLKTRRKALNITSTLGSRTCASGSGRRHLGNSRNTRRRRITIGFTDIGRAYLGLGEIVKSLVAYEVGFSDSSPIGRAVHRGLHLNPQRGFHRSDPALRICT